MSNIFCVVCWRPTYTKYYCREHLGSGETRIKQQNHKRRLINALASKGILLDNKLPRDRYLPTLRDSVYKLGKKPEISLEGLSYPALGFKSQATQILKISSRDYPTAYLKINALKKQDFDNKRQYVLAISETLGDRNVAFEIDGIDLDAQVWVPNIVKMLARYEVFTNLIDQPKPLRSGPRKGYNEDIELRNNLATRINKLNADGSKYTLCQLANEFGLSKPRICLLRKQLVVRKLIV